MRGKRPRIDGNQRRQIGALYGERGARRLHHGARIGRSLVEPCVEVEGCGLNGGCLQGVESVHGLRESRKPFSLPRDRCGGMAHRFLPGHPFDKLGLPAHHGKRGAKVVRKGGVHLAAILCRAPQLGFGAGKLGLHGFKLGAEASQLIVARLCHGEIKVVGRNASRRLIHNGNGLRQP